MRKYIIGLMVCLCVGWTVFGGDWTDTDSDGVADVCDNCVDESNASQTDSDSDGYGDACDYPALQSAVSRKTHGESAGTYDIDVGSGDYESRNEDLDGDTDESEGPLLIVCTFDVEVTLDGGTDVTTDVGTVTDVSMGSTNYIVEVTMSDVPFDTDVNLEFPGILNRTDETTPSLSNLCFTVLVGDYNDNGTTNDTDISDAITAGYLNYLVSTVDMARADFDCSGRFNYLDGSRITNEGLIGSTADTCASNITHDSPPEPDWDDTYTGSQGALSWNKDTDSGEMWKIYDASVDGNGADSSIFAVGSDILMDNVTVTEGKHSIRCARVYGGFFTDLALYPDESVGYGWAMKICEAWDTGTSYYTPSHDLTIVNSDFYGSIQIMPGTSVARSYGATVENVYIKGCYFQPDQANYALRVAAHNIWIEDCEFDFQDRPDGQLMRGVQAETFNGVAATNVVVKNCTMTTYGTQTESLVYGDRSAYVDVDPEETCPEP